MLPLSVKSERLMASNLGGTAGIVTSRPIIRMGSFLFILLRRANND